MTKRILRLLLPSLALPLIVAGLFAACSHRPDKKLKELVPELTSDEVALLLMDDDAMTRYVREKGLRAFDAAYKKLRRALSFSSPDAIAESHDFLLPIMSQVAQVLDAEHQMTVLIRETEYLRTASPETLRRWQSIAERRPPPVVQDVENMNLEIEYYRQLARDHSEIGWVAGMASAKYRMAEGLLYIRDHERTLQVIKESIDGFRDWYNPIMLSQALGTMGHVYGEMGLVDSMFVCWNAARQLGIRHGLNPYAARISGFLARHYMRQGRLSLAHTLHEEARALCEESPDQKWVARYIMELIEFHEKTGAYDVIERLLAQANALTAKYPDEHLVPKLLSHEANFLINSGRADEADTKFRQAAALYSSHRERWRYPWLLYLWSSGVLRWGSSGRALRIAEEGLQHANELKLDRYIARFHILRAECYLALAVPRDARNALTQFENAAKSSDVPLEHEWVRHDIVEIQLLRAGGDTDGAIAVLERALARVHDYAATTEATSYGYLMLNNFDALRIELHKLIGTSPELQYGIELYWNGFYRVLGESHRYKKLSSPLTRQFVCDVKLSKHVTAGCIMERLRSLTDEMVSKVSAREAVHFLYFFVGENVLRIEVAEGRVRRSTLQIPASELSESVEKVWSAMSKDPGSEDARVDKSLASSLHRLATILLPRYVFDAEGMSIGIIANNILGAFPFETLNLSTAQNEYKPLLLDHDVFYVRGFNGASSGSSSSKSLVITNPAIPQAVQRRHGIEALAGANNEATAVARLLAADVFLEGDSVEKARVLGELGDASLIYFAAHVLQDPELPFLTLMPLSTAPGETHPDAEYLDVRDIRSQDLRSVELVVLSGCSTGKPYAVGDRIGPSLGDAFLDAGAGAVVQTFWKVRDGLAKEQMTEFVVHLNDSAALLEALSTAKRSRLLRGGRANHPYFWAAYSIKLGGL